MLTEKERLIALQLNLGNEIIMDVLISKDISLKGSELLELRNIIDRYVAEYTGEMEE